MWEGTGAIEKMLYNPCLLVKNREPCKNTPAFSLSNEVSGKSLGSLSNPYPHSWSLPSLLTTQFSLVSANWAFVQSPLGTLQICMSLCFSVVNRSLRIWRRLA